MTGIFLTGDAESDKLLGTRKYYHEYVGRSIFASREPGTASIF